MAEAEFDKKIDAWVETINKHKGEETVPMLSPYPVDEKNFYGQQGIEYITPATIRHYCGAIGERNPLFWNEEYAKGTRWGGIIAPPTFTDAIAISWVTDREPPPVSWTFPRNPGGVKRELFQPIRPGDKIRLVDKWLGYEERKSKEPRPYRLFVESVQKSYINQKDEVAAACTSNFVVLITREDPSGQSLFSGGGGDRKRHKFTKAEIDAIYRSLEEDWRQGADKLSSDKVKVGDELKPLLTLPYTTLDSAAFFCAQQGHAVGFDIRWERYIKPNPGGARLDPETNAPHGGGEVHLLDGPHGYGYGLGYQFDGLLSRLVCNWMGDDGSVKELETRYRTLPILGDAYTMKGKVTNKSSEGGQNLVDLELRCENQDGLLISSGTAKVQLP